MKIFICQFLNILLVKTIQYYATSEDYRDLASLALLSVVLKPYHSSTSLLISYPKYTLELRTIIIIFILIPSVRLNCLPFTTFHEITTRYPYFSFYFISLSLAKLHLTSLNQSLLTLCYYTINYISLFLSHSHYTMAHILTHPHISMP